jgi:hypothetical protein
MNEAAGEVKGSRMGRRYPGWARLAAVLVATALVAAPLTPALAAGDAASAVADAQVDAQANAGGALWFGAGCLFGILGVAAGYLIEPSPPAGRLVGKPSEYVMTYTTAYKSEGKSLQGKHAIYGCLAGTVAYTAVYLLALGSMFEAASSAQ